MKIPEFASVVRSILCLAAIVPAHAAELVPHRQVTAELQSIASRHSDIAVLRSIGKTREARDIWMMQLAAPGPIPADLRPALFIAAGLEGDQVTGGLLVSQVLKRIAAGHASDVLIQERLRTTTLYILPRVSPDAAERGTAHNSSPYDDDLDGRVDEDGPEDLNGDGEISVMRVADPSGSYLLDPAAPHRMKKADATKAERGTHTLYLEGIDNDGDGRYNEDAIGGVDIDRNFQHRYPYYMVGAGPHMVSEPESRAVMDFLIARRNVAAMLVFGSHDNLIVPPNDKGEWGPARPLSLLDLARESNAEVWSRAVPPALPEVSDAPEQPRTLASRASERVPFMTVHSQDLAYFRSIGDHYRELTGISQPAAIRTPQGALFEFGYFQYGIPAFATPGWGLQSNATLDGPTAFTAWVAFQHPTLGAVEIGGYRREGVLEAPSAELPGLIDAHTKFVLYLASLLPRVQIASVEARSRGEGVFTVTAEVSNEGFLPTATAHGALTKSVAPIVARLGIAADRVLAGEPKTVLIPKLDGSGRRKRLEWVIRGASGETLELHVSSPKAGIATRSVVLR